MKKILFVSAAMLAATPAFAAPSATDDFAVTAAVAKACTMENIADINLGNLPIRLTAGADALKINGNTTGSAGLFYLSCNDTNSMTIVSANNGRLVNQTRSLDSGDDPTYTDRLRYRLFAVNYRNSGGQPGFIGGTPQNQTGTRGAIHRQINMTASVLQSTDDHLRPLAGNYQDTVTVTVTTI
jgi:spore coat protein U-like protein